MMKRNRIVYLCLVIILITGMCFVRYEADSCFAYSVYEYYSNPPFSIKNMTETSQSEDICTLNMLGNHDVIFLSDNIRTASVKVSVKSIYILAFYLFWHLSFRLSNVLKREKYHIGWLDFAEYIAYFIHEKDGKKCKYNAYDCRIKPVTLQMRLIANVINLSIL